MKSLCLIVVSLVAGVCHGQEAGKYAECTTMNTITSDCADSHLSALKSKDMPSFNNLKVVAELDNAGYMLTTVKLDSVCNDSTALEKYYTCAFGGIGSCLEKANSSQVNNLPNVDKISKAIVSLCDSQPDMNMTCLQDKVNDVVGCLTSHMNNQGSTRPKLCEVTEQLLKCAKLMSACDGGAAAEAYVKNAQPASCMGDDDASGARQYLASSLILGALLLFQLFQLLGVIWKSLLDKKYVKRKKKNRSSLLHSEKNSHGIDQSFLSKDYNFHYHPRNCLSKFDDADALVSDGIGLLAKALSVAGGNNHPKYFLVFV